MRKIVALGVVAAALLAVAVAPASADTPGCVSHQEFRRISIGDTLRHVTRVFDTPGEEIASHGRRSERAYDSCGAAIVFVDYADGLVTQKQWVRGE